jgi:hypothetical protein
MLCIDYHLWISSFSISPFPYLQERSTIITYWLSFLQSANNVMFLVYGNTQKGIFAGNGVANRINLSTASYFTYSCQEIFCLRFSNRINLSTASYFTYSCQEIFCLRFSPLKTLNSNKVHVVSLLMSLCILCMDIIYHAWGVQGEQHRGSFC